MIERFCVGALHFSLSPSLRGEGRGEGQRHAQRQSSNLVGKGQHGIEDIVEVVVHIATGDAIYSKAEPLQVGRPRTICCDFLSGGVGPTIDFNYHSPLTTNKIDKVPANRSLSYKFWATKPTISQLSPKPSFSRGIIGPQ
jgi:hypothetical protein